MSSDCLKAPNVSSVPQYSPLRYPGGKSRLYPLISQWLGSADERPALLIEPFAGAAHVSLAAAIEQMVDKALIVELDGAVAAVWKTILSDDYSWLMEKISEFEISEAEPEVLGNGCDLCIKERAFNAILRNRISRAGIIAPGAGTLNHGEQGRGIRSRWYPETLRKRIARIAEARDRLEFIEGDGLTVMKEHSERQDAFYFIDPPYPKAGRRLYKYSDVDPMRVFELACCVSGDFLMTYDDSVEITGLVEKYGLQMKRIVMSTSHHCEKYELIISPNLDWVQESA